MMYKGENGPHCSGQAGLGGSKAQAHPPPAPSGAPASFSGRAAGSGRGQQAAAVLLRGLGLLDQDCNFSLAS